MFALIPRSLNKVLALTRKLSSNAGYQTLAVTVPKEFVYQVSFNRPHKRNCLNNEMWKETKACFEELSENEDCRVVILSGEGQLFCAGVDLSLMSGTIPDNLSDDVARRAKFWYGTLTKLQESVSALELCRKPILTAIHSACLGVGVDIITATDMRYCTKDAYFQVKEVDLGLAADVGTLQRLPKIIGSDSLVRELCYTARKMHADEALTSGLVSRIYENKEEMLAEVIKTAGVIASKSPVAVQVTKRNLIFSRDHTVPESLEYMAIWNQAMLQSEDLVEALTGLMTKQSHIFQTIILYNLFYICTLNLVKVKDYIIHVTKI